MTWLQEPDSSKCGAAAGARLTDPRQPSPELKPALLWEGKTKASQGQERNRKSLKLQAHQRPFARTGELTGKPVNTQHLVTGLSRNLPGQTGK